MLRLVTVLGLVLVLPVWPGGFVEGETAPPADPVASQLEEYMRVKAADHHFSGTVLVARNGKVLLAKGYGYANAEWQIPNTLHTKFRIGSLTKQFTATLIMQLREAKLVDLQDSICKYLDPCVEAWKPVTLSHLLSHTSGIPGYGDKPDPKSRAIPAWTAAQIAASFHDRPLEFAPGTKWKYSDWGYVLLGMVIEKVTAKPYETVLQERIFGPLDMKDSGYDRSEDIIMQRAAGYRLKDSKLLNADYIDMTEPYSAGALYSTAEDLYKWDQALYTEKILPRAALDLMWTEIISNYGYGWMVSKPSPTSGRPPPWVVPGHFQVVHPGSINGFSSEICRFPDDHTTVIVLANLEHADPIGPELAAKVFGQNFSLPPPNTKSR